MPNPSCKVEFATIDRLARRISPDRRNIFAATIVTLVEFPEHCDFTLMMGTPACLTQVGMILSTGFFDVFACASQKSSAVAFPY